MYGEDHIGLLVEPGSQLFPVTCGDSIDVEPNMYWNSFWSESRLVSADTGIIRCKSFFTRYSKPVVSGLR